MNESQYQTVILAALLHDVGKLLRKLPPAIGQTRRYGRSTDKTAGRAGTHAADGTKFLDLYEEGLKKFISDLALFRDMVREHHSKDWGKDYDLLGLLVSQADHYSSYERPEEGPEQIDNLDCIFSAVNLGIGTTGKAWCYHPDPLTRPSIAFPTQSLDKLTSDAAYVQCVDGFEKEFAKLLEVHERFATFLPSLVSLLQRYAWAVPSDPRTEPRDISLFDHLRTTSAIAACLYLYHTLNPDKTFTKENLENQDDPKFLLVGGDLSGIQTYLYDVATIGAGGVAKRLRARSFYLSTLVEVVSHRLLRELVPGASLPIVNKIMAAGGKFTLLVPNLPAVHDNLKRLAAEVNGWLLRQTQGELSFSFATVPLMARDFLVERKDQTSRITEKLTELEDALELAKTHKLGAVLGAGGTWQEQAFLGNQQRYEEVGACRSCRKLPAKKADREENRLCPLCERDREIGQYLVQAERIAYFAQRLTDDPKTFLFFADTTPYSVRLLVRDEGLPTDPVPYLVERMFVGGALAQPLPILERPVTNWVPLAGDTKTFKQRYCDRYSCQGDKEGPDGTCQHQRDVLEERTSLLSFTCLATLAKEEFTEDSETFLSGEDLLGVLKADVDRLGLIFGAGLKEASLSRIATLSRMLDLFFGGWINEVLQQKRFQECYAVYSGGDDLLIVGPWTRIVELAVHVSSQFKVYTAQNPNVSLSAGIALTKPRFPIAKSSQLADRWLEAAKGSGRDRLHLFGVSVRWGEDLRQLLDFGDWQQVNSPAYLAQVREMDYAHFLLSQLRKGGDLHQRRGFIHRLLEYSQQAARWLAERNASDILYTSHLLYDVARNIARKDGGKIMNQEVVDKLNYLSDLGRAELMARMRLPITWTLLKLRGGKER